ncbi:3D domain-containing protein [Clostridium sp. C2-6-12]|uniref:3D domain-containing protein n=1 Tax=Clostridium sp. C2-6-12 TaxID=2698832 RepID=UPI0013693A55|nr:3D domain-containing protein [Clostridium sp. C2-6-12]
MLKGYKWRKVIKKSAAFAAALSIYLGTGMAFSVNEVKAATPNEIICSSTAYTARAGSLTASGLAVSRDPNGISTVSVDPSVIPFGTYLYIDGYGYAIAADRGSAIKGNEVDVFFTSNSECNNWGRQDVKVTILGDHLN